MRCGSWKVVGYHELDDHSRILLDVDVDMVDWTGLVVRSYCRMSRYGHLNHMSICPQVLPIHIKYRSTLSQSPHLSFDLFSSLLLQLQSIFACHKYSTVQYSRQLVDVLAVRVAKYACRARQHRDSAGLPPLINHHLSTKGRYQHLAAGDWLPLNSLSMRVRHQCPLQPTADAHWSVSGGGVAAARLVGRSLEEKEMEKGKGGGSGLACGGGGGGGGGGSIPGRTEKKRIPMQ